MSANVINGGVIAPFLGYHRGILSGTAIQPHHVTVFVSSSIESGVCKGHPFHYGSFDQRWMQLGRYPLVSIFTGALRVASAVKLIFKTLLDRTPAGQSSRQAQLKVGRYNLLRGLVEMVPLTFAALMVHDVKQLGKMQKALEMSFKEKNVAGVAIDGKVVATVSLKAVDTIFDAIKDKEQKKMEELDSRERDQRRLNFFSALVDKLIQKADEKNHSVSMEKIVQQEVQFLHDLSIGKIPAPMTHG